MGQIYILLAILLWSSLGIVIRFSGVGIHVFTFWSLIIAVALQGTLLVSGGRIREMTDIKRLKLPFLLGIAGLANSLTFFYALKNTTISNAVLTHYTAPVIVAVLAAVFLKEKITYRIVVAIIISSTGLYIMLDGFSVTAADAAGITAGLLSGISYAIIVVLARSLVHDFSPLTISFIVNMTIVLLLLPFVREFPAGALWSYLVMGIVHSTIAPALYYKGMQDVTAGRTAVLGYLEPICAILLGVVFLGEVPGPYSLLGGSMILFSGYITVMSRTQEAG